MKKTKVIRSLEIILLLFIISFICSTKVFASEASVSANNCNLGENFTVTVNIPQDVSGYDIGGITVTYSDGSTESSPRKVGANLDLSWPGNHSVTFPGKVAGNASITVSNVILSDSKYNRINSNSILQTSITITNPNPPAQTNPTNPSPSTGDDSSSTNPPSTPTVTVNFSDINEKMYTNRRVNVRQNCGTEYGIIQTLDIGTEVTRTGVGDKSKDGYSWSRISYNGITGYLITAALTDEAPEKVPSDDEEEPIEEPDEIEEPETDEDELAKMAEELGTIPEVGLNIMPFMFLGSCIACSCLMFEIKREIAK